MIPKKYILQELKKIDKLYEQAVISGDVVLSKLYSKLGVIELSGWVEECMDDLVRGCVKKKRLKEKQNLAYVEKKIIKPNHSFDYGENFRVMLSKTIGIIKLEFIEKKMNQIKKQGLDSSLTQLKPERNSHSHQTIRSASMFTAPSVCISLWSQIYDGLEEYEKHLKN